MDRSQSAQRVLAWLVQIGALVQFLLAGLAVFHARPHGTDKLAESSSFDAHRALGDALVLVTFALLVLAIVNREQIRLALLLFIAMLVQFALADLGADAAALGALHPVNGLLIIALAHVLTRGPRKPAEEAPPPPAEAAAPPN